MTRSRELKGILLDSSGLLQERWLCVAILNIPHGT